MADKVNVAVKVKQSVKRKAECVFKELGMNMHASLILYFHQIVAQKSIPFPIVLPKESGDEIDYSDKTVNVIVSVDEEVKKKCIEVLSSAGLSMSLAVNIYLYQVVHHRKIPFKIVAQKEKK